MTPSIILSDATVDDVAAVMAVMTRAFDPGYGEAWTSGQLLTLFAVHGTRLCVARRGPLAIGFYAARLAGPESELLLLAVDPDHRRGGCGQMLVEDWRHWAAAGGAIDLFLEVRADNPAQTLYDRCDFVECGRRPDYYTGNNGDKRDAVTMRRASV